MPKPLYALLLVLFSLLGMVSPGFAQTPDDARLVLVTGATGTQGGAVARELLKRGYRIRGLTRNPAGKRAKVLTDLGAEMVKGDFDDMASLKSAMQGAYAVFAVVNFWEHGYEREVQHGKNIAEAAKVSGVQHFIFSSVAHADEKTGIAHFDSKYEIEQYIHSIKLPATILRPVSFMDNWRYRREEIMNGVMTGPVAGDIQYQQIAAVDIARFTAQALGNPEKWQGRSLNIAAQQYTRNEIAAIFSRVTGRAVTYRQISWEEFEKDNEADMLTMTRWFAEVGYRVDIPALHRELPGMLTLEQYLYQNGWGNE